MSHDPLDEDLVGNIAFLLRRAQEASFSSYARLAGQRGLRPGHYAVLRLIHEQPGISQTDLSQQVGRDKTTMTPILQDFERKGLIRREVDPNDGRGRLVSLLPKGEAHLAELRACAEAHDNRMNQIVGADKDALMTILRRVIGQLDSEARLPPRTRKS
jgi:DNA-binding MarR family transcriptional regulator